MSEHLVTVLSQTRPGVTHQVDLASGTCSCEGFAFRGRCRHVALARAMRERGEDVQAEMPAERSREE